MKFLNFLYLDLLQRCQNRSYFEHGIHIKDFPTISIWMDLWTGWTGWDSASLWQIVPWKLQGEFVGNLVLKTIRICQKKSENHRKLGLKVWLNVGHILNSWIICWTCINHHACPSKRDGRCRRDAERLRVSCDRPKSGHKRSSTSSHRLSDHFLYHASVHLEWWLVGVYDYAGISL